MRSGADAKQHQLNIEKLTKPYWALIFYIMEFNDYNLKLTHLWVDGFGWENTIYQPSDFLNVIEFPITEDGSRIFYGYSYNAERTDIVTRKFKGIVDHRCHICGGENFQHTLDCTYSTRNPIT